MAQKIVRQDDLPDVLTAQHIANFLGISRRRVYELLKMSPGVGGIPSFEIGASKRATKVDFLAWIEAKKIQSAGA
ncbi:helix-turn-helix domain-containing protein [Heliophilum fasciatum]|uniref:Helix-turn-helix protein n=1 Tax=Heliophilum fasciatum TaxID=35700 RepID=A0A4R2RLE0_9FIRM|nr:helix-turn-helix domain-containing protein [Heliophilum fasciatum]MCW2277767.1 putative DNA-binding transcriptional regulator AlpA [Heliophilum fasciatum]TCP64740.1 helix-turn-helix protein [Heliophilum fasciatum]